MSKKRFSSKEKNERILQWLFIVNTKKFVDPVVNLQGNFGLLGVNKNLRFLTSVPKTKSHREKKETLIDWMESAYKERVNFIDGLSEKKRGEFLNEVARILRLNQLGLEWAETIMDMAITGLVLAPGTNLYVRWDKRIPEVKIYINAETTLNDIKEAWPGIQEKQEEIFGKRRKPRISKEFSNHLLIFARDEEMKMDKLDDVVEKNKYQPKDLDVVGKLFEDVEDISEIADLRRRNLLRQIRRRMKKFRET